MVLCPQIKCQIEWSVGRGGVGVVCELGSVAAGLPALPLLARQSAPNYHTESMQGVRIRVTHHNSLHSPLSTLLGAGEEDFV